ncbi:MAG: CoA ester lyase [Sulfitobacter sp.]
MDKPRRTLMFTPATRSQSFDRALETGADVVCVDLEDAVPPQQKDDARADGVAFLKGAQPGLPQRALRINHPGSIAGIDDLAAVLRAAPTCGMLLIPKVGDAAELRLIDMLLTEAQSDLELAALIETLDGLENVQSIAQSTPRLRLLVFGGVDLSGEMGAQNAPMPMAYPRARIVHAGKRAGLDVMDVPELDFRNEERAVEAATMARDMGFTGKAAVHPATLSVINDVFTPSSEEIEHAQKIIAAYDASPNGLVVMNGQLIEAPVVRAMQRRLAIADITGAGRHNG